ncbi:phage holin family protein [Pectobacteriaceae bacterium CE90]|nr:phage holin family protein [Prodigiosinella sp. LS101]WJV54427.1 phage holin family protein [Prodigiosinella sp. LS101]WJV58788.1 phage holin family protein [Pectobacteriaceae bacterium C111]WJY14531.1 phage holin family protein [Pectobacteriaceae bacterium CE90]
MTEQQRQGPASSAITSAQRIITIIVGMVETRVRLAVIELEQEKTALIQLLLVVELTLLFTVFGLIGLITLIIWSVEPQYRLMTLGWITGSLFILALIGGIWTLRHIRKSTLLKATRKTLEADRALLEGKSK